MRTLTHIIAFIAILLIAGQSSHAQTLEKLQPVPDAVSTKPAPSPPTPPKIIFPTIPILDQDQVPDEEFLPSPPEPKPPQKPKFISELSEETWLVIESPEPLLVTSSPLGHVAIQPEVGPVRVRGKFADGTGKVETRVFKSANLYFINAVSPGKVEILIYHAQLTEEKDIPRYTLNVMGVTPNPPPGPGPKPEPGPKPDPDPMPDPASDHLMIEIVEDPLNRKPDTAIVLSAIAEWNALKDKGHDWRIYSPRTSEPLGKEAIASAKDVPQPAMIIRDKSTRKVLRAIPLPLTMADVKRVLSELTGNLP
jgi:hypothetical protein